MVGHALDMQSVGNDGFGLSQAINHKLENLIAFVNKPLMTALHTNQENNRLDESTDDNLNCNEALILTMRKWIVIVLEDKNQQHNQHKKTKEQVQSRMPAGFMMGMHHVILNPFPATSKYPLKMNVIHHYPVLTQQQEGGYCHLKVLKKQDVNHFDSRGSNQARM